MNIEINIYGRDYSKVDYRKSSRENNKTSGVEFKGELYNETIAKVIVRKFLQRHGNNADKYIVGRDNTHKNKDNNISYYTYLNNEWWYQNVVGILVDNNFSIDHKDIREFSDTYMNSTDEVIIAEFEAYLEPTTYTVKLQIQTRFDGKNTYFLPTMLSHGEIKLNDYDVPVSMDNLFDFLLVHWYKVLLEKAYAQGIYKTYQRFNNNDTKFKGSLDVARHIRLNIGMNSGNIAYSYRENTTDNALNHLILHTYIHMKRVFPTIVEKFIDKDYAFKKKVNEIQNLCPRFSETNVSRVLSDNYNIISHPFYLEYEALRQVCIKILNHIGISVFDGTNKEEAKGILYYIPDLWESYLKSVIEKKIDEKLKAQEKHKVFVENTDTKDADDTEGRHSTYPDFIFYNDRNVPIMILDAKFKEKWGEAYEKENIYLDDYTKCIRDMNTLNTHATGVVFPVNSHITLKEKDKPDIIKKVTLDDKKIKHHISKFNKYDYFYSFPVIVPETDKYNSYSDWKKDFEKNQEQVLEKIKKRVEKEKTRYNELEVLYNEVKDKLSDNQKQELGKLLGTKQS